jgi:bacterioferritin-associated ferredoxin
MSRKVILCRCEDVTLADVQRAVAAGYADLEEVKRYTGFGTGPCQGKECLREITCAIARASGRAPETIAPFTTRPPLVPTELRVLAGRPARAGK